MPSGCFTDNEMARTGFSTKGKMEILADLMTSDVITVSPDSPVSAALDVMEKRRISALVVARQGRPLGVFTERALIQIRVDGEISYSSPISLVMSSPCLTARLDKDYREAYQMLLQHQIRHLVVVDAEGLLAGIVTATDFLSHLGLEYFMEFKNVSQVMSKEIITLLPTASALSAMKLMNDRRISSLVMVDKGFPTGIITERDLLRLIRSQKDLSRLRLEKVMSQPVETVFSDVSSHEAAKILIRKGLRRLVVTNSSGQGIGIVTETDMVKGLRTSYTDHLKDVIRKQARQLREVKEQVEETFILDSMLRSAGKIAISIMDTDLHILLHNRAAESLYEEHRDGIVGKSGTSLHDRAGNLEEFQDAVKKADQSGRHEFILKHQVDAALFYLATTIFTIHDQTNKKIGFGLIAIDITAQKETMEELELRRKEVEDANIALKVMLDEHTKTRENIEEKISIRLKEFVNPYLDILRATSLSSQQREAVNIISGHIESITQTFSHKARKMVLGLSPRETMIADLVYQGKTSKQISELLTIGLRTVETYRNNLRKKLGINNKKISLRTYLLTNFSRDDN
ncbi:MAG: CBS domain-containing protein [Thermodesulfobacteriota bacterium]